MRLVGITILLVFTASLFACGGYYAGSNSANSNQANGAQTNSIAEDSNLDANANMEDLANANTNIQNSIPLKRPVAPKPEMLTRPAPDDSEITAENNAEGDLVETRIFKNHDMVAKVERILTASRRNGSVRIF